MLGKDSSLSNMLVITPFLHQACNFCTALYKDFLFGTIPKDYGIVFDRLTRSSDTINPELLTLTAMSLCSSGLLADDHVFLISLSVVLLHNPKTVISLNVPSHIGKPSTKHLPLVSSLLMLKLDSLMQFSPSYLLSSSIPGIPSQHRIPFDRSISFQLRRDPAPAHRLVYSFISQHSRPRASRS